MMPPMPYMLVDVFTDVALRGNPVAVFTAADGLNAREMQDIAREMNLSETVFVCRNVETADITVRIFTPVNELPFAGHPLLGTAMAVAMGRDGAALTMATRVGVIPFTIARTGDPAVARIEMRQPMPAISAYPEADLVLRALDLDASTLPVDMYVTGPRHVFVGVDTIARLSAIRPDLRGIAHLPDVAFNCFAGDGERWRLRMFSPAYGVAEDSGTGSAASPLLLHLIRHGLRAIGDAIAIEQGVEMGRHSLMHARATGATLDELELYAAGSCVVVGDGRLTRWKHR